MIKLEFFCAFPPEGKQYKYYKINLGNTSYSSANNITQKSSEDSSNIWWLRSPFCYYSDAFGCVYPEGICNGNVASNSRGVAPGFSI